MDRGYLALFGLLFVGGVYGVVRARWPQKKKISGWLAAVVLVILIASAWIASRLGHETTAYLILLATSVLLSVMFFVAIGSAIGSGLATLFRIKNSGASAEQSPIPRGSKTGNALALILGIMLVLVFILLAIGGQ
ncbi:MAG TPA: hypothetical protein VFG03_04520 [Telluria sp.]|nr:hypothetical protein [Telluria sp.]